MNKKRFQALCVRHINGCAESSIERWFEQVLGHYREPHRHYHTPEHVEHCLRQLDLVPALIEDRDALEFAIWYHDVIYQTGEVGNERASAQLFQSHVQQCMPEAFVGKVVDLIMVTVHCRTQPESIDQEFMVDIDLSSFGLPWPQFLRDSQAVRDESCHLDDAQFYPGQARFLRSLLERPNFCHTQFFRQRHEAQARENIARYLEQLTRDGLVD